MSEHGLDAVLERIARLWSELQVTRTRDPKHAKLMAEIHDQSAAYLRLLDLQKWPDKDDSTSKTDKADKTAKAHNGEKANTVDETGRVDKPSGHQG